MEIFLDCSELSNIVQVLVGLWSLETCTFTKLSNRAAAHFGDPQLPCIVHNDTVISQPTSIVNYIIGHNAKPAYYLGETTILKGLILSLVDLALSNPLSHAWYDKYLLYRTFLVGNHVTLADIVTFWVLRQSLRDLDDARKYKLINLMRWADHVQHIAAIEPHIGEKISLPGNIRPRVLTKQVKEETKASVEPNQSKQPEDKKKQQKKQRPKKQGIPSPGAHLEIRVGRILQVEPHAESEDLYVLNVDIGQGDPRQIVAGIGKYFTKDELTQVYVIVVCNIKPRTIKGAPSHGLVLFVKDGESLESLQAPGGSTTGDRVTIDEHERVECEEVSGNKWEQAAKLLKLDGKGIAQYDGKNLRTTKGIIQANTILSGMIK